MEEKKGKVKENKDTKELKKVVSTANLSERFASGVVKSVMGAEVKIPDKQMRLLQQYYIALDGILKEAETKRQGDKYKQNDTPITWKNVNMVALNQKALAFSQIGLNPALPNHINMMPFKNNKKGNYDIVFIEGYKGLEVKAKKYGLDFPDEIVTEVVYETDKFRPIKKSFGIDIETYEFEMTNPFNRGEIVGGFYYLSYNDTPEKNKVVAVSMKDIEKRKPTYASAEFWGGEKDEWKDKKRTGKKIKVEGWTDEMTLKTIKRMAYNSITLDGDKLDDAYVNAMSKSEGHNEAIAETIKQNANIEEVDAEVISEQPEIPEKAQDEPKEVIPETKEVDFEE